MDIDLSDINSTVLPTNYNLNTGRSEENELFDKAHLHRFKTDTSLRKILSFIFTFVIIVWLGFVLAILCKNSVWFKLSDGVLITLITTTTVQVIGMMLVILRNLFPQNNK